MLEKKYYEMVESVRWFRAVGLSNSNTWIGRSRAIDTVYRPVDLQPGDQVCALFGAAYVRRAGGGVVESGGFVLPKSVLEKGYGGHRTDADRLADMALAGRCREIPEPGGLDFSAVNAFRDVMLPDLTGSLEPGDHPVSPFMAMMLEEVSQSCLDDAAKEAGAKLRVQDVGAEPESSHCALSAVHERGRVSVRMDPCHSGFRVIDDLGFQEAVRDAEGMSPAFRNEAVTEFPERDLAAVFAFMADWLPDAVYGAGPKASRTGR